jgi:hypothetical protein
MSCSASRAEQLPQVRSNVQAPGALALGALASRGRESGREPPTIRDQ